MNLNVGDSAPDFELYSNEKEVIRLSDLTGDHHVVILFFPGAFTGVCTNEMNVVNNELDVYTDRNTKVIGVSTDSPFVLGEFAKVNRLNFNLLSDHNAEVSTLYGVNYDPDIFALGMSRIARRSAFVIDKDGKIRHKEVLESAGNQPDFDAIKEVIASL